MTPEIFLSLTAFQTIHDLTARPLTFLGIISSIKLLQKYIPHNIRTSIKHESFFKKTSRLVYKKLVSGKSEPPNQSQLKWQEDVTLTTKQELNWEEVYQIVFQCTKSTKLITFNFKFLHRRISTNNFLKKLVSSIARNTLSAKEKQRNLHIYFGLAQKRNIFGPILKYGYSLAKSLTKRHP